jgi:hypothetical protein
MNVYLRHHDAPYQSMVDAMSDWVEVETAIGARLTLDGDLELVTPCGVDALFQYCIRINPKRPKPDAFKARVAGMDWHGNYYFFQMS